ncbi:hypothetical protein JCM5353_000981 [Sporobolomyces roseus]
MELKSEPISSPLASSSKLPSESRSNEDQEPKPKLERSVSPVDSKGKGKQLEQLEDTSTHLIKGEDEDQEMNEEEEEKEEIESGDQEEEVLMTIVPKANINGLKYSGGIRTLKEGMKLEVRRDKYNANDRNAIEVRHVRGLKIGFVSRVLAGRLAPLINERKIRLTATAGPGTVPFSSYHTLPTRLMCRIEMRYSSE